MPQSDSPGPAPESGLFLEVVPSSQHLPLSFPPFPDWGQVSTVPVPAQCHHVLVPCHDRAPPHPTAGGFLVWGRHWQPQVCTGNRVASGPSLPPHVPVSPAHGDEARFGEALQAMGNLPSAQRRAGRAPAGSDAVCVPQACACLARGGGAAHLSVGFSGAGISRSPGAALGWAGASRCPGGLRRFPWLLPCPGSCWLSHRGGHGHGARGYTCHRIELVVSGGSVQPIRYQGAFRDTDTTPTSRGLPYSLKPLRIPWGPGGTTCPAAGRKRIFLPGGKTAARSGRCQLGRTPKSTQVPLQPFFGELT